MSPANQPSIRGKISMIDIKIIIIPIERCRKVDVECKSIEMFLAFFLKLPYNLVELRRHTIYGRIRD